MARPHRLRADWHTLAATAVTLTLVTGTVTSLAGTASADIAAQIRASQAALDQLNQQAERAAERYNKGRIALADARNRASVAAAALARVESGVVALRKQEGAFASQVYRTGSAGLDIAALSSAGGAGALLDRLGTLDELSRGQSDVLSRLATARHREAESASQAATAAALVAQTVSGLEADKRAVDHAAHAAQAVLAELQVKEAALIQAAADAAARQAAQARAAELALQARLQAASLAAFDGQGGSSSGGHLRHYSGSAAHIAVQAAQDQLGKPYVWGAEGPDSFDCSGLTKFAYAQAGISLPHYTGDQWNSGRHVMESQLVPGDLIFFGSDLHHMGMYLGGGRFIHAPHSGDVVKISALSGYYQDNYAGAVRIAG